MEATNNPYTVVSNQPGLHPKILAYAKRYRKHCYRKPINKQTQETWQQLVHKIPSQRPILMDSGCGKGMSSRLLAQHYPYHTVIAVDQSIHRLSWLKNNKPENLWVIQADVTDIWQLCALENRVIDKHYLLYPNPWPKKKHYQRRWHGHPIFPTLLSISKQLEIRTNWLNYLQECSLAANTFHRHTQSQILSSQSQALTHFEKKYFNHQTPCYQLNIYN